MSRVEIRHFHLFCGLGGGAKGFNRGEARVGRMHAKFRCIGGVDVDAAACADFGRLVGVPATHMDLFSRDQYVNFHGREPADDWREATPQDIQRAAGGERPHIVFLSAPCKGFSGLLAEKVSKTGKYQALNALTLRGVWLMQEAWAGDPPELIVFENVPRIMHRGRPLLDQIGGLLRRYGYVVAETTHDCGEIGNLAQSRKRFLLVARHAEKVPPFLYEPAKHRLRGVGEVLSKLPVPGPEPVLPMHRMPSLQWKTWVRLAFVEAGSDWRSLNRLNVEDGVLADYGIVPEGECHNGAYGVKDWEAPAGTVTAAGRPGCGSFAVADPRPAAFSDRGAYGVGGWEDPAATLTSQRAPGQGRFSVADPRIDGHDKSVQLGVRPWDRAAGVVTGKMFVGGGPHAVADPRVKGARFNNLFRIVPFDAASPAIAGPGGPGGGLAVADPRGGPGRHVNGKYRVAGYGEPSSTVLAASTTGNGAFAVADPRYAAWHPGASSAKLRVAGWGQHGGTVTGAQQVASGALSVADPRWRDGAEHYLTGGHYGVMPWQYPAGAVSAAGQHDNGRWSVADPRDPETCADTQTDPDACLPEPTERLVAVIKALDGTWHRPFTTLELAALQSLVDPDEILELDGLSDSAWRERIGNAVPPDAARAIASTMGRTLLLAWSGETFALSSEPIWVRQVAVGLSVDALEVPA